VLVLAVAKPIGLAFGDESNEREALQVPLKAAMFAVKNEGWSAAS
jgi:hypothetical protein